MNPSASAAVPAPAGRGYRRSRASAAGHSPQARAPGRALAVMASSRVSSGPSAGAPASALVQHHAPAGALDRPGPPQVRPGRGGREVGVGQRAHLNRDGAVILHLHGAYVLVVAGGRPDRVLDGLDMLVALVERQYSDPALFLPSR